GARRAGRWTDGHAVSRRHRARHLAPVPDRPERLRVLVTGASGMLGRATVERLVAAGHDVRTFQRRPSGVPGARDVLGSLTDPAAVARAVEGRDAVLHLAAKV